MHLEAPASRSPSKLWLLWLLVGAPIVVAGAAELAQSAMRMGVIDYSRIEIVVGAAGLIAFSVSAYGLTKLFRAAPRWRLVLVLALYAMIITGVVVIGGGLISCLNGDCI